jgi:hypothetical protein
MVKSNGYIPNHQFGIREGHSRTEQTRRIVQRINEALENKQYCSATFLDIFPAFDKMEYRTPVKVKTVLPSELFHFTQMLSASLSHES